MRKIVTVLICSLYFTLVNLKLDMDYRLTRLILVRYQPGSCSVMHKLNTGWYNIARPHIGLYLNNVMCIGETGAPWNMGYNEAGLFDR